MDGAKEQPAPTQQQQPAPDTVGVSPKENPPAEAEVKDTPPAQPATAAQLQETETNIEQRMSAFERSMIRLTRAGVAIGIITGLIFLGQLYEMISGGTQTDKLVDYAKTQSQAADDIAQASADFTDSTYWMEEHMGDAADAMQDSVDTAANNTKTTIDNAQRAFRDDQRAWLGVSDMQVVQFEESKPLKITVFYVNAGKTPARNVKEAIMFKVTPAPVEGPDGDDMKRIAAALSPANSVPPQGKYTLRFPFTSDASNPFALRYSSLKSKSTYAYFIGELQYDDVSGRHHATEFCIYLSDPDTKELSFCNRFNEIN